MVDLRGCLLKVCLVADRINFCLCLPSFGSWPDPCTSNRRDEHRCRLKLDGMYRRVGKEIRLVSREDLVWLTLSQ